jgi:hypothetical protein
MSSIEQSHESTNQETVEKKQEEENMMKKYISFISWYIVFLGVVPKLITHVYSFDTLRKYFPVIDLIANVFATVFPQYLFELYSSNPTNLTLFISTNFISLIALLGVSWNIIYYYKKYKNMWFVIKLSSIWYIITYLLPTMGIPYFLKSLDSELDITSKSITFISGILFIVIFANFEAFLAFEYINLFK